MGLTTFVAERKANTYAKQAQELINAVESGNPDAAWEEVVDTRSKRDGTSDEGRGAALEFQAAISDNPKYTGRIRSHTEILDKDGKQTGKAKIILTVGAKQKPRIKGRDTTVEPVEAKPVKVTK